MIVDSVNFGKIINQHVTVCDLEYVGSGEVILNPYESIIDKELYKHKLIIYTPTIISECVVVTLEDIKIPIAYYKGIVYPVYIKNYVLCDEHSLKFFSTVHVFCENIKALVKATTYNIDATGTCKGVFMDRLMRMPKLRPFAEMSLGHHNDIVKNVPLVSTYDLMNGKVVNEYNRQTDMLSFLRWQLNHIKDLKGENHIEGMDAYMLCDDLIVDYLDDKLYPNEFMTDNLAKVVAGTQIGNYISSDYQSGIYANAKYQRRIHPDTKKYVTSFNQMSAMYLDNIVRWFTECEWTDIRFTMHSEYNYINYAINRHFKTLPKSQIVLDSSLIQDIVTYANELIYENGGFKDYGIEKIIVIKSWEEELVISIIGAISVTVHVDMVFYNINKIYASMVQWHNVH